MTAAALLLGTGLAVAAPASADGVGTVKARTQRMSDPTLNSHQDGWYDVGQQLTLSCSTRGQATKGYFSFNIPNGGWDNLWYKTSDGHFVSDVDIETGTLNVVAPDCTGGPAPAPNSGHAAGQRQAGNPGVPGQCTWGALQKWFEASGYYPDLDGNAANWANSARAHGWTVVDDAQPRSIVVFRPGLPYVGADGHVAWVNSVSQRSDGRWINITEMNNQAHGGAGHWWTRDVKDVPGMSYILMP
jgi:surface antigen